MALFYLLQIQFSIFLKSEILGKKFVILTTGITDNRKIKIKTHFESWHIISLLLHKIQYDK